MEVGYYLHRFHLTCRVLNLIDPQIPTCSWNSMNCGASENGIYAEKLMGRRNLRNLRDIEQTALPRIESDSHLPFNPRLTSTIYHLATKFECPRRTVVSLVDGERQGVARILVRDDAAVGRGVNLVPNRLSRETPGLEIDRSLRGESDSLQSIHGYLPVSRGNAGSRQDPDLAIVDRGIDIEQRVAGAICLNATTRHVQVVVFVHLELGRRGIVGRVVVVRVGGLGQEVREQVMQ